MIDISISGVESSYNIAEISSSGVESTCTVVNSKGDEESYNMVDIRALM